MFFYVGGLGRCGAKWLSKVLHRLNDRMVCYYNMLSRLEVENALLVNRVVMESTIFYPAYFVLFKELSQLALVGDANSWPNHLLGYVLNELDAQKMVWLVRDGIVQVHDFDTWLDELNEHNVHSHAQFVTMMKADVDCFGTPVEVSSEWGTLSQFQQLCWWWSIQQQVAQEINKVWQGPVNMVRIEALRDSISSIVFLLKWINPLIHIDRGELHSWLGVEASPTKDPKAIWKRWGTAKRNIFKGVCGSTMEVLGYEQYD